MVNPNWRTVLNALEGTRAAARAVVRRGYEEHRDDYELFVLLDTIATLEPVTMPSLSDRFCRTPSTMLRLVQPLERAGLVDSADGPTGRRNRLLSLTADGRARLDDLRDRLSPGLPALVDGWEEEDLRRLLSDLLSLQEALLGGDPPRSPAKRRK